MEREGTVLDINSSPSDWWGCECFWFSSLQFSVWEQKFFKRAAFDRTFRDVFLKALVTRLFLSRREQPPVSGAL